MNLRPEQVEALATLFYGRVIHELAEEYVRSGRALEEAKARADREALAAPRPNRHARRASAALARKAGRP